MSVQPTPSSESEPIVLLMEHALKWTELDETPDELSELDSVKKPKDLVVMACASANILTMSPNDEVADRTKLVSRLTQTA